MSCQSAPGQGAQIGDPRRGGLGLLCAKPLHRAALIQYLANPIIDS
ncbi:unnamed protein product [Staurois parvus]|uniref:Uncharacterized protein n=1 Tax=Staurois parvus TaxID=386267 RepID=A0ABN9BQ02_9NEOB|nr:unnamed protein product [Staurois parvus]